MSDCPRCNLGLGPNRNAGRRPAGLFRRAWRISQWLFPATLLALLPKCPMCVAAYVALFTGIGISVATARSIQILLLVFCLTALAYLALRLFHKQFHDRHRHVGFDLRQHDR